jgi:cellulose synthase/poly-beta-1,6-N-acetylglucosamine synthase-like glycosyltransferase
VLTVAVTIAAAIAYLATSFCLFVFGGNLLTFAIRVWRRGRSIEQPLARLSEHDLPRVTVQLPIYNELYVSQRIIEAACALDYPGHLLQIQVLDDSTDETVVLIRQLVERAQAEGVDIEHLHRSDRRGYKAGALAAGMDTATGEFLAIFDADFVPGHDFLLRTVHEFSDPKIAFVQARWGHLNRDYSWLTRVQALAIDGHFLVEQSGRGDRGYWFNFNGTAGIWRAEAIRDAGGWTADTLTEDLDLSYRAHLRGWRARYLEDLVVPAELPTQVMSFRRQQHRWARGSIQCARRLLPEVWRSEASIGTKFQATMHLCAYGIHLLLLGLLLIYPAVIAAGMRYSGFSTLYGAGYLFAVTSIAPGVFFAVGQRQTGKKWWREVPRIMLVTVFGSGLMLNTARAALEIFTKPNPEFERTAKLGLNGSSSEPWAHKRYQLGVDKIVFAEIALAAYAFGTVFLAYRNSNIGILIYAAIFGSGLLLMAGATIAHAVAAHRGREQRQVVRASEDAEWGDLAADLAQ